MQKKKKTRKVKVKKRLSKRITPKKKGRKKNPIPENQLESMDKWLAFYKEHKKLPHNRVICSNCKMDYISLRGFGMVRAMKSVGNDINRVLTESICKSCKTILNPPQPKEKKERVVDTPTREEIQARRDAISETLPKVNFHREKVIFDLTKDRDMCEKYTHFACHRPDIYLDRGCIECSLQKNCACRLKDVERKPDDRRPKFKMAVFKPKTA